MTAVIKLIPKKGDITKIGNWRPISLLSNFYKIISRAINVRLQQIVDRVLSRSQKGFTKSRQIQEVIINCRKTMDYCRKHKIKGVIASIDQAKAFDSVSHSYMEKVYEFFGFGARIKRWLRSIGTNRSACILLADGNLSDPFDLGKGHAQGDSPSPLLYNLAAQIQIFRIELDAAIVPAIPSNLNPIEALAPRNNYKGEGLGQNTKNESFADDSSNLIALSVDSLSALKDVLHEFKIISGLSCNIEKSFVMRIGDLSGDLSEDIINLGFTFTDKLTLLGFQLQNYGDIAASNFEKIGTKIDNLIRFWERFYLSLPGKLTIYKTFLLSQINYFAAAFTPGEHILNNLEKKMEQFVTKGFSVAKNRIYSPVENGGLGMFRLKDFTSALKCSWIKRSVDNINDNWKYTLATVSGNNVLNCVNDNVTREAVGDTIFGIIESFCTFRSSFSRIENNFLSAQLYCNNAFGYGRGNINKLDSNFFETNIAGPKRDRVLNICWNDLTINGNISSKIEMDRVFGFELSNFQYNGIVNAYRSALNRFHNAEHTNTSIRSFIVRFKKGSRYFRKVISSETACKVLSNTTQCRTFMRLIDCNIPSEVRIKDLFTSWYRNFYNSEVRVFLFKFYGNILGLNSRVTHFNPDINGGCTFCILSGDLPPPSETFAHLFFECKRVADVLETILLRFLGNNRVSKENFFLGTMNVCEQTNKSYTVFFNLIKYLIWRCKLEKKIPSATKIESELKYMMSIFTGASKKLKEQLINYNIFQNGGNAEPPDAGRP
jgi:hypothetical protein